MTWTDKAAVRLSDRTKDRCSGIVLFVAGLGLWFYSAHSLQRGLSGPTEIGPEFFPQFLAVALMVLSPGLVIKSFLKRDTEYRRPQERDERTKQDNPNATFYVFAFTGMYVLLAEPLGFVPATLLTMAPLMWLLSVRRWYFYVALVIFVLGVQHVFQTYMYIQLP
ncbi:tripartite tricarboxylate transporter TctB family protein [Phytoactinopolyspora halophila]|uniref:tripartite tricarboxylate transporter TctB family protein n=1 Tax=Phytoactinopolyspora halophila TaxID=1981511 RepID=UPI0013144F40|nr:tripartite tricarboxylate transporter TctB family protein [Phytoactinopolyspora halophila]